jgi:DNA polymerase
MDHVITIDTETYFADDYTLSKMTTEAYVRDPRFKLHMIGAKMGEAQGCYPAPPAGLKTAMEKNTMVAHHAHFDGLILNHHYGVRPAFWFDTLPMARLLFPHYRSHSLGSIAKLLGLQEKTVPYESFKNIRDLPADLYNRVTAGCLNDVELTHAIFLKMLPHIPRSELHLIDLTIRLFTEPALRLDRDILTTYIRDSKDKNEDALAALGVTKEELNSSEKFACLLRGLGVEPPTKISKKTGEMAYAFAKTDAEFKKLLDSPDPRVEALVAARLGIKSNMVAARAERLLSMDSRGPMCVYLNIYGAHTLRWSGGDLMNWQNFKRGSVLRYAILAPPSYQVVVVDASQIEARLLDWLAGEEEMLAKWRNKDDIYSELASEFYGEKVDKSKPDKRGTGKQIVLSCGFGAGADSIKNTARLGTYGPPVHLTDAQALEARNLYRRTHPKVKGMWEWAGRQLLEAFMTNTANFQWGPMQARGQRLYAPGGAWIDYSNIHYNGKDFYQKMKRGVSKTYGGKMVQNAIELLSRTVLAEAALKVATRYKIVTMTHDELVFLAPTAEAPTAYAWALELMKTPAAWAAGLPLDAEGGYSDRYNK